MKALLRFLFILLYTSLVFAQDINQLDAQGKHHGIWKKNFEGTNVLRYEGEFLHGKENGLFKFYKNITKTAVLTATKQFNETDKKAEVKFFASNGKVISEGLMDGKLFIGEWKYYQKTSNQLLTLENYNNSGKLEGERFVYYPNAQIAEKQFYKNGLVNGISQSYSEKNVLLKEFIYENDTLHGMSKIYNPKGELVVEGAYKQGKKHGVWKYYENGKLTEEKDFTYKPKYIKKSN